MKIYNAKKRVSAQLKKRIEKAIATHERYKKSFFYSPAKNAGQRRRNEKYFLEENPDFKILLPNDKYIEVSQRYDESCSNVYYKMIIIINDTETKKSNISQLKKLLK